MIACSMETIRVVVDSLEQLSTVIVAIMGFVTAMVVAKVTSGLELKKTLCLKRVEAYEMARCQLMRMTNVYENILGCMAAICQDTDSTTIREKTGLLIVWFTQLATVLQQDRDLARIALYTELPRQDVRALMNEEPKFMKAVRECAEKLQGDLSNEEQNDLEKKLKSAINTFAPLAQGELRHLYAIDEKLKSDLKKDRRLKVLTDGV